VTKNGLATFLVTIAQTRLVTLVTKEALTNKGRLFFEEFAQSKYLNWFHISSPGGSAKT
jgi:hypothetical protein